MEDRVGEVRALPGERRRDRRRRLRGRATSTAKSTGWPARRTRSSSASTSAGAVVSSSEMPMVRGVDAPEVHLPVARAAPSPGRPRPAPSPAGACRSTLVVLHASRPSLREAPAEDGRSARAPGRRWPGAPRARGRRRTCRPSPPAAPARCRCCWSPSRGGCAARGSAAPCAAPGARGVLGDADDAARQLAG